MLFHVITIIIAVTAAVFVLAAQMHGLQGESDGVAIPLTKRSDTDARKFHATSHSSGNIIRDPSGVNGSERNSGTRHLSAVQRNINYGMGAGVDLTKSANGIWYATILIGTPPRSFTVQLNTGSSDLFVPTSTGDLNCISHSDLWNPASSQITNTDLNIYFRVAFADGRTVSGKQYTDRVTIAAFTTDSQTIGAATTYSSTMDAHHFAPDGVLGLAFPSLSQLHGRSPLMHTLFNEGKLSRPMFSLRLTETGGELYIGGINTELYDWSTLVFTPVTQPFIWQLMIEDIRIHDTIVLENVPAIIDTGANFINGNIWQVTDLHKAGGGTTYDVGFHTFPCRKFPSVTFTIGGRPFVMPPSALNKGKIMTNSRNCFTGITGANGNQNFWTLGTIFLEQFYTVFDFNSQSPRLGFAYLQAQPETESSSSS